MVIWKVLGPPKAILKCDLPSLTGNAFSFRINYEAQGPVHFINKLLMKTSLVKCCRRNSWYKQFQCTRRC